MAWRRPIGTPWAVETGDNYQRATLLADPATGQLLALPSDATHARRGASVNQGSPDGAGCSDRGRSSWGAALARLPGAAAFLPVGFPDSVRPEYLEYQAWDTVQVCVHLFCQPCTSSRVSMVPCDADRR